MGFLGLGKMGSGMVANLRQAGVQVHVFDVSAAAAAAAAGDGVTAHGSPLDVVAATGEVDQATTPLISMLPNDTAVRSVFMEGATPLPAAASTALSASQAGPLLHISCSTISPALSGELQAAHAAVGQAYIGAPVFARPDGIARKEASFVLGGDPDAAQAAGSILATSTPAATGDTSLPSSGLYYFGASPGAGNVVKLCGNFLIASTIEGLAEAAALAENSGVDREGVINMLTSTIFDCLIYKGYGQRVGQRDHKPGGFALDLGKKDVSLVLSAADAVATPMPLASLLRDRFVSAQAAGWGDFDWSGIGLKVSADAGVDVSDHVARVQREIAAAASTGTEGTK